MIIIKYLKCSIVTNAMDKGTLVPIYIHILDIQ